MKGNRGDGMGMRQAVKCLSWVKKDLLRRFPEVQGDFLDDEIDRIIVQMKKRLKKGAAK